MNPLKNLTFPLTVVRRIQETPDTVSFILNIPESVKTKFNYLPGQFITLDLNIGGESIQRSYSLASSPATDSDFKITVKRVEGGRASNYLIQEITEGATLNTTPPAGHFFKVPLEETHFYLFAAGSGITPIISILKSLLRKTTPHKTTLFYSSRYEEQIIFEKEIKEIEKSFPRRFKVYHFISKPKNKSKYLKGRITKEFIKRTLSMPNPLPQKAYYLCGPMGFMENVEQALFDLNIDKTFLRKESFTVTQKTEPTPSTDFPHIGGEIEEEGTLIGPNSQRATPKILSIVMNGETHSVKYNSENSVLDCLIEAGLNVPYSCMSGNCMACLAKVTKGQVLQEDLCVLTEENVQEHETLTCQCKPVSEVVELNFEDI